MNFTIFITDATLVSALISGGDKLINIYIYMLLTEREVRTGGYCTVEFFHAVSLFWTEP